MRRIVRPPKPRPPQADGMTTRRAWKQVVPRIAEEAAGLVASVHDVVLSETTLTAILDGWVDGSLTVGLVGGGRIRGLAVFDAPLVVSMLEAQTTGVVLASPPGDRRLTDADAALTIPFVDGAMAEVATLMAETGRHVGDWTCGRRIASARAASLLLEDGTYVQTEVTLALADGARTGVVRLYEPDRRAIPGVSPVADPKADDPRLAGRVEIRAILFRGQITLETVRTLAAGSQIPLPGAALDHIMLETTHGKELIPARLGRLGPHQAVRIGAPEATNEPPPPMEAPPLAIPPEMAGLRAVPLEAPPMPELPSLPDLPDLPEPLTALPDLPDLPPFDPAAIASIWPRRCPTS